MPFFRVWSVLVRWVIPIAIGVILVLGIREKLDTAGASTMIEGALTTTD
jgi:hypothetical protein